MMREIRHIPFVSTVSICPFCPTRVSEMVLGTLSLLSRDKRDSGDKRTAWRQKQKGSVETKGTVEQRRFLRAMGRDERPKFVKNGISLPKIGQNTLKVAILTPQSLNLKPHEPPLQWRQKGQ